MSVDTYLMGFIGCKNDGKDSWYVNVFDNHFKAGFFFLSTVILSIPKWFLEASRQRWDGGCRGGGTGPVK